MAKLYKAILTSIVFFILTGSAVLADRAAPKEVEPLIYKGIKIVAENSSPSTMGVVSAFDIESNKLLWSKEVYRVKIKRNIEADTQWVFIKELKIEEDTLVVINEKYEIFKLNPYTGELLKEGNKKALWKYVLGILVISSLGIVYVYRVKKK